MTERKGENTAEHTLRAVDLSVAYRGNAPILRDVAFEFAPGSMALFSGANGAGKTTLLRTLAGLLPAAAGTVEVRGETIATLSAPERARVIAWVPEALPAELEFTVEQVVRMGRFAWGGAGEEFVEAALRDFDLESLRRTQVRRLSFGQQRRTHLARAWATDAKILILDEPDAGLDAVHLDELVCLLRAGARKESIVLVSSHRTDRFGAPDTRHFHVGDRSVREETLGAHKSTAAI